MGHGSRGRDPWPIHLGNPSDPWPMTHDPVTHGPLWSANLQLELLSLQSDPIIKADYQIQINKRDLFAFHKAFPSKHYPRRRAQRMPSLFGSSYICEQTFSLLKLTKSKVWSRLTDEHVAASLRLNTTELKPDLMKRVHQKQPQKSH